MERKRTFRKKQAISQKELDSTNFKRNALTIGIGLGLILSGALINSTQTNAKESQTLPSPTREIPRFSRSPIPTFGILRRDLPPLENIVAPIIEGNSPIILPRIFTPGDTLLALEGASPLARCIVRYEVGGGTERFAPYDPNSVGGQGELGAAQLHPEGLLPDFYKQGYNNPNNPYQVVAYLEQALQRGLASHWSTLRYCL